MTRRRSRVEWPETAVAALLGDDRALAALHAALPARRRRMLADLPPERWRRLVRAWLAAAPAADDRRPPVDRLPEHEDADDDEPLPASWREAVATALARPDHGASRRWTRTVRRRLAGDHEGAAALRAARVAALDRVERWFVDALGSATAFDLWCRLADETVHRERVRTLDEVLRASLEAENARRPAERHERAWVALLRSFGIEPVTTEPAPRHRPHKRVATNVSRR